MSADNTPKLLKALDALVRGDKAPARLSGSVLVAVKGSCRAWFWHAAFEDGALLGCGYLEGVPPDVDAILLFDEAQAADVVEGVMPRGRVARYGEQALLEAFTTRYGTFRSMIDIRAGN